MKFILSLITSLTFAVSFSQISLSTKTGIVINDGDILTFNSFEDPDNYMGLKIYNNYNEDIYVKIKIIALASNSNLQLCISPICVPDLVVGESYPSEGSYIPANGQNGNADHFVNYNAGDGVSNLDYVFKLIRVDENNVEVGNSITFTYRYSPNLSNSDFNQLISAGIQLKSTVIKNNIDLQVTKPVTANIYDLNGKLIVNQSLVAGDNSIEALKLASGLYLLNLTTSEGKKVTVKIVKE